MFSFRNIYAKLICRTDLPCDPPIFGEILPHHLMLHSRSPTHFPELPPIQFGQLNNNDIL
jgi:hypothetical protein